VDAVEPLEQRVQLAVADFAMFHREPILRRGLHELAGSANDDGVGTEPLEEPLE
jgi:hypothetical protein